MNNQKVKAYFSHTIRGPDGSAATEEDARRNCKEAVEVAKWLRESIPELEIYVPGEHEFPPVGILLHKGYITVEQILEVDCMIIDEQDLLVVLVKDGWMGGGIGIEMAHAKKNAKPIFLVEKRDELTLERLGRVVKNMILLKKEEEK